jgi:hypothetical protein
LAFHHWPAERREVGWVDAVARSATHMSERGFPILGTRETDEDDERCPFCNARRGEPCGLEEYDELGQPKCDPLPCALLDEVERAG